MITRAAAEQLDKHGVAPAVLFGSDAEAIKFKESMTVFIIAVAKTPPNRALVELCYRALQSLARHNDGQEIQDSVRPSDPFPGHPGSNDLSCDHIHWAMGLFREDTRYSFHFVGPINPGHPNFNWANVVSAWEKKNKRFLGVSINTTAQHGQDMKGHWVGFLADLAEKTLEYFDPLGNALHLYTLVEPHFARLQLALEGTHSGEPIWKCAVGAQCVHQTGGVECGLFGIWFFSSRLHGTSLIDLHKTRFPDEGAHVLRDVFFTDPLGLKLQGPDGVPPEKQIFDVRTWIKLFQTGDSSPKKKSAGEGTSICLPTGGAGQCALHAAFGTWHQEKRLFFADKHQQMRECFVRYLFFYDSIAEMLSHAVKGYARHTLADFYNSGNFPPGFAPTPELRREIEVHTSTMHSHLPAFTKARARITELARLHAGALEDSVGTDIIDLLGASILAVRNPTSAAFPLAEYMRDVFDSQGQVPNEG